VLGEWESGKGWLVGSERVVGGRGMDDAMMRVSRECGNERNRKKPKEIEMCTKQKLCSILTVLYCPYIDRSSIAASVAFNAPTTAKQIIGVIA
jgi:hypothetical protein